MEQLVRGVDTEKIAQAVRMILEAIGEDPERDGLRETPRRVAEAYAELCSQVGRDPGAQLKTFFETAHDDLVIVRDIPFYSLCEHHLAPFFGLAHIGYIPQGGVVTGLSKLARCVESAARRPQIQEIMTGQIADAIMDRLAPQGVIVVLEAEHLCMTMRGVKKPGSKTITSAVRGVFRDDPKARAEALALIRPER